MSPWADLGCRLTTGLESAVSKKAILAESTANKREESHLTDTARIKDHIVSLNNASAMNARVLLFKIHSIHSLFRPCSLQLVLNET